jgi:hypothetical protein
MNDDIYDWREDCQRNHHTYTTAYLIGSLSGTAPHTMTRLNLAFWHHGLEALCGQVIETTHTCERTLRQILVKNSSYVTQYILPLQKAAQASITQHSLQKQTYGSSLRGT